MSLRGIPFVMCVTFICCMLWLWSDAMNVLRKERDPSKPKWKRVAYSMCESKASKGDAGEAVGACEQCAWKRATGVKSVRVNE